MQKVKVINHVNNNNVFKLTEQHIGYVYTKENYML